MQIKILIYGRINVKFDYPKGVGLMNTYKAYILRIYPTYSQKELIKKLLEVLDIFIIIFLQKKNNNEKSKTRISVYEQLKN